MPAAVRGAGAAPGTAGIQRRTRAPAVGDQRLRLHRLELVRYSRCLSAHQELGWRLPEKS
jgi:hypothetical protein